MSRLACQLRLDCSTQFEAVAHLHRAGCDPRQNPLDILIREILQSGVRRACGVVFPKHVRDRIRVKLLRLGQQAISFSNVPDRLLV
jgi:hypothetical protein